MNAIANFFRTYWKAILYFLCLVAVFFVGLVIPSPFFHDEPVYENIETEEVHIMLPDSSHYDGYVMKGTKIRYGYGKLILPNGTTFEGEWRRDVLAYGTSTTDSATYRGNFDPDLCMNGFGIITYNERYIRSLRDTVRLDSIEVDSICVRPDSTIAVRYAGNWRHNVKQGLGRSFMCDSTLQFGYYKDGALQPVEGACYCVQDHVYGIDISHYQQDINWNQLALYCDQNGRVYPSTPDEKKYMLPVSFVYMKATEGATMKDLTYSLRAVEAERHGIAKGAYHFLHLGTSIQEQVHNFTESVTWSEGDLPPALDVELYDEITRYGTDGILEWLVAVEAKMHVRPIIYTRESIRNKLLQDPRFQQYDFWYARYKVDSLTNTDWHLWQFTEEGCVGGYEGPVDVNYFDGDYWQFTDYLSRRGLLEVGVTPLPDLEPSYLTR